MIPKPPDETLERTRECILILHEKPRGPGGAVVPKQTTSAIVFPHAAAVREWLESHPDAAQRNRIEIINGDPVFCGAEWDDWDWSCDRVYRGG